jgi:sulfide:quinone oxidoreductase
MKKDYKNIVIVGSSFAGIKCAWELRHRLTDKSKIILISDKPTTVFRASFPHILFGDTTVESLSMDLAQNFQDSGIEFVCDPLVEVDQNNDRIVTQDGVYEYDYLVLATGVRHAYEILPGSKEHAQTICDPTRIIDTKKAIDNFRGGIVYAGVGAGFTPCDGPQFEVVMNLDYRLRQLGVRDKTEIHYITDKKHLLPPAGPKVWEYLGQLCDKHNIIVHLDTYLTGIDSAHLYFQDNTEKAYDLCILIPPYRGIKALENSSLIDERGFVPIQPTTMRATLAKHYNIYAIGDCIALAGPKQGHLALMQAQIATEHLAWRINQEGRVRAYLPEFKCVMDLGGKEGLYIYSQYMSDGDVVEIKRGHKPYESKLNFERQWFAKRGDIGELHHQIMK